MSVETITNAAAATAVKVSSDFRVSVTDPDALMRLLSQ